MASTADISTDHRERRDNRGDHRSLERGGDRTKSPALASSASNGLYRHPSRNMNNIESSVTRLLVATKELIDTLTKWSRRLASETDVSDVYVKLGNEFNVARTCFERAGIDMKDLADIPNQLRTVLETCLARDASPRILEIYLPQVREIVINLLQGLKRKQARYRARATEREDYDPSQPDMSEPAEQRRKSPARRPVGGRSPTPARDRDNTPGASPAIGRSSSPSGGNDALAKLQAGDALQRRASKRYSAYNFAKLDEPPPVPARRSGSYSPEIARSPPMRGSSPRRERGDERKPQSPGRDDEAEGDRGRKTGGGKVAVFLQLGNSVRKTNVVLREVTMQSLRLLFVEKFQYNPGAETFPHILITDKESGMRYILESMDDIVENTTLTLDVAVESSMQKTFQDGMSSLLKEVSSLQHTISSQQSLLRQLTEQHFSLKDDLITHRTETLRKIDSISTPKSTPPTTPTTLRPNLTNLRHLKQELSTLESEHKSFMSSVTSTIHSLRSLPYKNELRIITDDTLATQKSDLESKTQALVTLSDDLSDQVDDLRIDITEKRIRPHPRTLAAVKKGSEKVKNQLKEVESMLNTFKPLWKKAWQDELQRVIDGQEFLRHQETLVGDLKKDLMDTEEVVVHVVQAAELLESRAVSPREWLSGPVGSGGRDAVLGEVKTVQPNSAERIEAIARAEKARARELELRRESEFQVELGEVVNEEKLKVQSASALRVEEQREKKEKRLRELLWQEREKQLNGEKGKEKAHQSTTPLHTATGAKSTEDGSSADKPVKRAVSEGSSAFATAPQDDGVARSQSHPSGLSRTKRISGSKRISGYKGDESGNRISILETDENEDSAERDAHHKIGVLEKDVV